MRQFVSMVTAIAVACTIASAQAKADFSTVSTFRSYYNELGNNQDGIFGREVNNSYFAGRSSATEDLENNLPPDMVQEYRNYFVFDLTGVTDPVTSARILAFNPGFLPPGPGAPDGGPFGFTSNNGTETYSLFDVSPPISTLTGFSSGGNAGSPNAAGLSIFNDLGTGTLLGTYVFTPANNVDEFIPVELNAAGLAYLNARLGGQIAFGGAVTTNTGPNGTDRAVFIGTFNLSNQTTPDNNVRLVGNAVPLPPTVMLLGLGGLGMAGVRRLRRHA